MYNSAPLFNLPTECPPHSTNTISYATPQAKLSPFNDCRMQFGECIPYGYQPKQPNPGQLKFNYINYPFPDLNGNLKKHPGKGWHIYNDAGLYYLTW